LQTIYQQRELPDALQFRSRIEDTHILVLLVNCFEFGIAFSALHAVGALEVVALLTEDAIASFVEAEVCLSRKVVTTLAVHHFD
jgi:hypothetical protein